MDIAGKLESLLKIKGCPNMLSRGRPVSRLLI